MNKVFLNGYLAADPIQRIASTGTEIASIRVGVSDVRSTTDTYFFNCTAFGVTAKYINNNLKKGSFVAIDGRLRTNSYVNSNGQTVNTVDITIDNIRSFGLSRRSQAETDNVSNINEPIQPTNNAQDFSNIHANLDDVFNTNTISNSSNNTLNSNESNDDNDIDWDDEF